MQLADEVHACPGAIESSKCEMTRPSTRRECDVLYLRYAVRPCHVIHVESVCASVGHEYELARRLENRFMRIALYLAAVRSGTRKGQIVFDEVGSLAYRTSLGQRAY